MLDFSTVWRSTAPYSDVQLLLRAVKAFQHPKWDSQSQPPTLCPRASLEHLRFTIKWKLEWRGGSISSELWSQDQKEPWGARMTLSICHLLIGNKWLHGSVESFWTLVEWNNLCLMDQSPIPMMVFPGPRFCAYALPNPLAYTWSPPLLKKECFGETGQ